MQINLSPQNNKLALGFAVDPANSSGDSFTSDYTITDPTYQPDGDKLPSEAPDQGNTEPPLPPEYQPPGYTKPFFNYKELPRIASFPSINLNISATNTEVIIAGFDFSPAILNFDWFTPLSGPSTGKVRLLETRDLQYPLDPELNGFNQGVNITIKHNGVLTCHAYIIGYPDYFLDDNGTYVLDISIGCQLALLENTTRTRKKYCGRSPRFAGEAASIYADQNNLFTRLFPRGHDLVEEGINSFADESAHSYLSALYVPTNRDVRCNKNSEIICPIRQPYNPSQATNLSYKEVLESAPRLGKFFEPFTKLAVKNEYSISQGLPFETKTSRRVSGDPGNTKPWFNGGYTEVVTTTTTYGDTEVFKKETTYGYVPTNPLPWAKALVEEDPCINTSFNTQIEVIEEKTTQLFYYPHESGSLLISGIKKWTYGKKLVKLPSEDYDLYDGIKEHEQTQYTNTPQPNREVCTKDYIFLQTDIRTDNFKLTEDNVLYRDSFEEIKYRAQGVSVETVTEYTGSGQKWIRITSGGQFNEDLGQIQVQPTQIDEDVSPPTSDWIRPVLETVFNFGEFSLIPGGNLEPKPQTAPFCYNQQQLETFAIRKLRETYGLSKGIMLTVPITKPIGLNQSVLFTDRFGRQKEYTVYSVEINQTAEVATKTLLLMREIV